MRSGIEIKLSKTRSVVCPSWLAAMATTALLGGISTLPARNKTASQALSARSLVVATPAKNVSSGSRIVTKCQASSVKAEQNGATVAKAMDWDKEDFFQMLVQLESDLEDDSKHALFGFQRWDTHRRRSRHWRHVLSLGASKVFTEISPVCAIITGFGALAPLYEALVGPGSFPHIAATPYTLTTAVISLLLVFRTNASYDRYWEARKLWARLIQRSRDLARQSAMWVEDEALREMALRYTTAFPIALKCHLTTGTGFDKDLKGVLRPSELEDLVASNHKPLHITQILTEVIRQSRVSEFKLSQMDQNLTAFADVMGACERILRCPIPLSYTRHTSRAILLYCSLLPMVLFQDLGLAMIPTAFIISYAMLGIEQIGVDIEEPFHLMPLGALASLSARNVKAVRDSSEAVRKMVTDSKKAVSVI